MMLESLQYSSRTDISVAVNSDDGKVHCVIL